MGFQTFTFLFGFLPMVLAGYYLILFWRKNVQAAMWWLIACSLAFFLSSGVAALAMLLLSLVWNYLAAWLMTQRMRHRARSILILACAGDIALLAVFKYHGLIAALGISYYTFQQIGYLMDVYRGEAQLAQPAHYCLWVSFYPKATAGPILRHEEVLPKLKGFFPASIEAGVGISFIVLGLLKKLALANALEPYATFVFSATARGVKPDLLLSWLGLFSYAGQLYFDFSGYSDIAIGLGLLLGFKLPFNFNSPYKAASIIDFWRRWHITLSRFLTEYVFFSLPGSRSTSFVRYCNLILTMLLCGWWHGASLNFIVWGGFHGLLLVLNHLWRTVRRSLNLSGEHAWSALLARSVTLGSVVFGWGIFAATSLTQSRELLAGLLGWNGLSLPASLLPRLGMFAPFLESHGIRFSGAFTNLILDYSLSNYQIVGLVALVMSLAIFGPNTQELLGWNVRSTRFAWMRSTGGAIGLGVLFFVLIKLFIQAEPTPFVYGRF